MALEKNKVLSNQRAIATLLTVPIVTVYASEAERQNTANVTSSLSRDFY